MRYLVATQDAQVPDFGLPVVVLSADAQGQIDAGPAGYAFVQRCEDGSEVIRLGPLTQADVDAIPACAPGVVDTLRARAQQALVNNATYLGLASPTNAQVAAQVKALTRQMNAVIRLVVGALDSTSDS